MKTKAKIILIVVVLVGFGIHVSRPSIDESRLERLITGTTTVNEARGLFGIPRQMTKSSNGREHWHYSVPLRFGYLDLYFDQSSKMTSYNYERF